MERKILITDSYVKYLASILVIICIIGCKKEQKETLFQIPELVSEVLIKNNECSTILNKHFGVVKTDVNSYNFIDGISNRITNELKSEGQYVRAILIRTYSSGEVVNIHTFSILIFPDKTLLSEHIKNTPLVKMTKTIKEFDSTLFYEHLKKNGELNKKSRRNIMVIDFKDRTESDCQVYGDIAYKELKEFFDL